MDLLAGGQGVFGIALGRIWREVEGTLADLPAEHAETDDAAVAAAPAPTSCPGAAPAAPASIPASPRRPGALCAESPVNR